MFPLLDDKVPSFFLRSGVIILLLISLLVMAFPVQDEQLFIIPIIFVSLGISIVVLYFIHETIFRQLSENLYSKFNSEYRTIIVWYLFYFVYLEILACIQYYYSTARILSFTLSPDFFLVLSAVPFVITLVYPWFSSQIGMMRQTDRKLGTSILVDCAIFYRRHKHLSLSICLSMIIFVILYYVYITGKSTPGTIGWMLSSICGIISSYVIRLLSPYAWVIFIIINLVLLAWIILLLIQEDDQ